jgi:hypothetical protein
MIWLAGCNGKLHCLARLEAARYAQTSPGNKVLIPRYPQAKTTQLNPMTIDPHTHGLSHSAFTPVRIWTRPPAARAAPSSLPRPTRSSGQREHLPALLHPASSARKGRGALVFGSGMAAITSPCYYFVRLSLRAWRLAFTDSMALCRRRCLSTAFVGDDLGRQPMVISIKSRQESSSGQGGARPNMGRSPGPCDGATPASGGPDTRPCRRRSWPLGRTARRNAFPPSGAKTPWAWHWTGRIEFRPIEFRCQRLSPSNPHPLAITSPSSRIDTPQADLRGCPRRQPWCSRGALDQNDEPPPRVRDPGDRSPDPNGSGDIQPRAARSRHPTKEKWPSRLRRITSKRSRPWCGRRLATCRIFGPLSGTSVHHACYAIARRREDAHLTVIDLPQATVPLPRHARGPLLPDFQE